jgi:hypothetical protein
MGPIAEERFEVGCETIGPATIQMIRQNTDIVPELVHTNG